MAQQYLVTEWKAMLQMVVNLCGKGYRYYHLTELPINKQNQWGEIDEKIISKYKTNKSKWQRQRAKAKGIANFYFLRWEHVMVVLHTEGVVPEEIVYDDKFSDIRQLPIFLKISELSAFRIQIHQEKIQVTLDKETYRGIKYTLHNAVKSKNVRLIKSEFDLINGYPAYKGILAQKNQLAHYVMEQAKKHHVQIKRTDLRFTTQKKTVKNFDDSKGSGLP